MCPSSSKPPRFASAAGTPPDIRPAFDVLDADRDGKISREDLRAFYDSSPIEGPADDDVIASMISAADTDRDGFVEYDEFERVVAPATREGFGFGSGIMEEVFRVMDRDGDGRVGFEDLKTYLACAGMRVSDEDVRAMIRMGGGDEAEGVGFESLVKILAVD